MATLYTIVNPAGQVVTTFACRQNASDSPMPWPGQ